MQKTINFGKVPISNYISEYTISKYVISEFQFQNKPLFLIDSFIYWDSG